MRRWKYSRARLVGENWHKVVFSYDPNGLYISTDHVNRALKQRVEAALERIEGNGVMRVNVGHHISVWVKEDDDLILLRLLTDFTDSEYRGCGDWSRMKYHSAKGNRITANS